MEHISRDAAFELLKKYNIEVANRPMIIAANKMDAMSEIEKERYESY